MTSEREYMTCSASAACDSPRVIRHLRNASANVTAPDSDDAADDVPLVPVHPVLSIASTSSRP
ncbi:hypothetical protein GCM10027610_105710 [Dactylosporangium cerinum]